MFRGWYVLIVQEFVVFLQEVMRAMCY